MFSSGNATGLFVATTPSIQPVERTALDIYLCLVWSPWRVFSPSPANMSRPETWDQAEVTCWRLEEKAWRVEREERRSAQMAVLHLARKSGN